MGEKERHPNLKGHLRKGALGIITILVAVINLLGIYFFEIAWIGIVISILGLYIIGKAMFLAWFKK